MQISATLESLLAAVFTLLVMEPKGNVDSTATARANYCGLYAECDLLSLLIILLSITPGDGKCCHV
jgi:hypothetical protein